MTKYTKKVTVGQFAKKGIDVKDRDIITIANEGKKIEGQFGQQDVFLVKLANGEEKNLSFNQTSINGLIDAYGEDSTQWIGKTVKIWIIKQNVAGKFTDVLYVSHPAADLTQDGFVMADKAAPADAEVTEEEIDASEIPF